MPIEVNDYEYRKIERDAKYNFPVMLYERDVLTDKIVYPPIKCENEIFCRTPQEEEHLRMLRMMRKADENKQVQQLKVLKLKYEAENLKNCKDNALMMGEKHVKDNAERQFLVAQWDKEEQMIK